MDLLKYLSQSKMIQASRNGMGVGIKIPITSGIPGAYSALWYELALFPIEGEVGKSAHDAYPCASSCAKPAKASSPFRQS